MFILNNLLNLNILKYLNIFNSSINIFKFLILIVVIILVIICYIYYSLSWAIIAKKLNYKYYWIAWIPIVNFFLKPILAKKNWLWGFIILIPIIIHCSFSNFFENLIFLIFYLIVIITIIVLDIIWTGKIYKRRNYASELALLKIAIIIPFTSFFGFIVDLVIISKVAWKDKDEKDNSNKKQKSLDEVDLELRKKIKNDINKNY
jgi:hypothetical protein